MVQDRHLLTDIRLELRHAELRPVYIVAEEEGRVPGRQTRLMDFGTVSGRDNLGQAILMRLLTPLGELSALAHPEYGSRLHELIGRPNTETTRNLVKLFILESLQLEPRIQRVLEVTVEPDRVLRDLVQVTLRVQPVGETGVVVIGPFALELGQ